MHSRVFSNPAFAAVLAAPRTDRAAAPRPLVMQSSSPPAVAAQPAFLAPSAMVGVSQTESPIAKFVISGSATWVFELVVGHYMEFLKIAKQTSDRTYLQITRSMVEKKGLSGVLDGFFPWGSLQAIAKGAVFGAGQAASRRVLDGMVPDSVAEIASGGIGGGFQGLVLSPLLLLKTRVMTNPRFRDSGNILQTTKASARVGVDIVRTEGAAALMKGSIVFSGKRVADWTTRYFFAEMFEELFRHTSGSPTLSLSQRSSAALLGGTASALVTIPIDVLVATFQDAKRAGTKVSIMDVWKEKLQSGGVRGLVEYSTRGYVARVLHVALTTLLMKTVTSSIYQLYKGVHKEERH